MAPNIKSIVIADNRQIFGLSDDNKIYRWDFTTATFMEYWYHPGQQSAEQTKPSATAGNHQDPATPNQ